VTSTASPRRSNLGAPHTSRAPGLHWRALDACQSVGASTRAAPSVRQSGAGPATTATSPSRTPAARATRSRQLVDGPPARPDRRLLISASKHAAGHSIAIVASARKLACLFWCLLTRGRGLCLRAALAEQEEGAPPRAHRRRPVLVLPDRAELARARPLDLAWAVAPGIAESPSAGGRQAPADAACRQTDALLAGAREAGAALPGNEAVVCAHRRLAEDDTQAFAGARLGPKTRLLRPERQKRHLRYRSSMPSAGGSRVPGAPPTAASPRCAVPMPPDAGDRSPVAGPPRSRCLRRQARPPQRRSRRRCRLRRQATAFSSSRSNAAWRSAGG
jgi:hypothetical protein